MNTQDLVIRYWDLRQTWRVVVTQLLSIAFAATVQADMPSRLDVRQTYRDVFPSVDFVGYKTNGLPEYDWIVRPGGDAANIRMHFGLADDLSIDRTGDLVIRTGLVEVRHTRPFIYQEDGAVRRVIEGRFRLIDRRTTGFEIGLYDHARPLIIDPQIVMGASFGGSGSSFSSMYSPFQTFSDSGVNVALDAAGNIYIAGHTASMDFPLIGSSPPASFFCFLPPGPQDASCIVSGSFIAKLDPTGSKLLYSTFVGDPAVYHPGCCFSPVDASAIPPIALAVDSGGNAYVTGAIGALAVKLDPSGKVVWSQGLQGADGIVGTGVALEPSGRIAIAGTTQSGNLPVTSNAYRTVPSGASNVFLMELDGASGSVQYSTYLGPGSVTDYLTLYPQVAVAPDGGVVVATTTNSANWPTTAGVVQPAYKSLNSGNSDSNVMLLKLDTATSVLRWATYLEGSGGSRASAVATGPGGGVYVTGTTYSPDFPFTPGAIGTKRGCGSFLTRLDSSATSFVYSACGGGDGLTVDAAGNAYVTGALPDAPFRAIQGAPIWATCPVYGSTTPQSHSLVVGYQICASGGALAAVNPSGNSVLWSTYLGHGIANGVAVDSTGTVTVTGNYLLFNATPIAGKASVSVVRIGPDGEPPVLTVTNGASLVPGLPAPGGLASLFATGLNEIDGLTLPSSPLPVELAGVRLLVGGVPAPILAVSGTPGVSQQINFQVPVNAVSSVLELQYAGKSYFTSGPPVAVGIFTLPDGTAAVQHAADFSLVTRDNPIRAGEIIVIYTTGLIHSGSVLDRFVGRSPVVTIGKSVCTPQYAGGGSFTGVDQINCVVSTDINSGDQPLQIYYNEFGLVGTPPSSAVNSNIVTVPVK